MTAVTNPRHNPLVNTLAGSPAVTKKILTLAGGEPIASNSRVMVQVIPDRTDSLGSAVLATLGTVALCKLSRTQLFVEALPNPETRMGKVAAVATGVAALGVVSTIATRVARTFLATAPEITLKHCQGETGEAKVEVIRV